MARLAVRHWLPVALVAGVVLGVASSVGAQVDPSNPAATAVWGASCVSPGSPELVIYGRAWAVGPVAIEIKDQGGAVLGVGAVTASGGGGRFQGRIAVGAPPGATLRILATQAGRDAEHTLAVGSCSPTITAVGTASCAVAGNPVILTVTVRGAPTSTFDLLLHHADLAGPAETIDRSQPARPNGDYSFNLAVANVPNRVVPVTVEARRPNGTFAYATTNVGLPPGCAQPNTTAPTIRPTVPSTTQATTATTTPATSPGPVITLPPFGLQPGPSPGSSQASLAVFPVLGRAGEATTVAGRGFAPSSTVTLRWRPGIGQWTVRAGADGTFRTQVLILPKDIEGPRSLEVLEGGATPARFLVVPGSDQPAFNGVFVRS